MIGVYKLVNPKGKIYIGQSVDIEKRFKHYKALACKGQVLLYASLKKYGWDNHTKEILEECEQHQLLERETYWKIHFRVLEIPSLCCRIDGRGGSFGDKMKQNLSKGQLKYWEEIKQDEEKLELRLKKLRDTYSKDSTKQALAKRLKGVKKSQEHIEKLTKSQNKIETVEKRKKSLREYWDNMDPEERDRLRRLNIETQRRPDVICKHMGKKHTEESKARQSKIALNREKLECPHCGKKCDPGNAKRHHFQNCKFK